MDSTFIEVSFVAHRAKSIICSLAILQLILMVSAADARTLKSQIRNSSEWKSQSSFLLVQLTQAIPKKNLAQTFGDNSEYVFPLALKKEHVWVKVPYDFAGEHPWACAAKWLRENRSILNAQLPSGIEIEYVEPNVSSAAEVLIERALKKVAKKETSYQRQLNNLADYFDYKNWPKPPDDNSNWYLLDEFSGLSSAHDRVVKAGIPTNTTIAHLDRGYCEKQEHKPANLDQDVSHRYDFAPSKDYAVASDFGDPGIILGHGTGTGSILASSAFGGDPNALVIPMPVSNSVILMYNLPFCEAVTKAIEDHVDVISMSMGGMPSRIWATTMDLAYEAGITLCAAGSDCGYYIGRNSDMVWPARFDKAIAVTGATYKKQPYYKYPGYSDMQGSFGPDSAMDHAIAAFSPNVSWAKWVSPKSQTTSKLVDKDGAGTSAATPQVAAASSLWLKYHYYNPNAPEFKDFDHTQAWQKIEAVKAALFNSADRSYPAEGKWIGRNLTFFGNGLLRANNALDVRVCPKTLRKNDSPSKVTGLEVITYLFKIFTNGTEFSDISDILAEEFYQSVLLSRSYTSILDELLSNPSVDQTKAFNTLVHCKSDIHSNQLSNFLRKSKFIPKIEKSDPLDCVHTVESAKLHQMEVQDTVIFPVDPGLHWNHTKLIADKGQEYSISAKGEWYDMGIPSSATGYGKSHLTQKWFEKDRRVKDSKWMALEIVVGNELKSPTTYTHDGQLVEVSKKGEISMFANDVCGFYWNNFGKMSVSITRTK